MASSGGRRAGSRKVHGRTLVLFFAAGVTALAVWGFDNLTGFEARPFWDKLYASLQLFVLESGSLDVLLGAENPPTVPWQLQLARFLAPLVTVFTAVAALSALALIFREQFSRVRVRWLVNDHVLICGLGRCGSRLAKSFRARGDQVVVIEADELNRSVGETREAGAIVLTGNGTDRALLRKCRLQKARCLIAVCGDDGVNAEVTLVAHSLTESGRSQPLSCYAQVADVHLRDMLREFAITSSKAPYFRLDAFDAAERGAPLILAEFPPFDEHGDTALGPPHPLVVGVGQSGSQFILSCAQAWERTIGTQGRRLPVTLIDREAELHKERLRLRFPRLEKICDLHSLDIDVDSPEFQRAEFLIASHGPGPVTSIYICLGDDARALITATTLRGRLRRRAVPVVVRTTQRSQLSGLPAGLIARVEENVHVFQLLDKVCTPDVLLRGMNEVLARTVHEDYVRAHRQRGDTPEKNPSMVPWEVLPNHLKDSNRRLADSFGEKLATIGREIHPSYLWEDGLTTFSPDEIELLARLEHDRWCKEREAAGWVRGPEKDIQARKTPYLVPWDELPQEIRDNDRDMVRGLPAFLARAGFVIVERGAQPVEDENAVRPGRTFVGGDRGP
jgi:hypothetical protein